MATKGVLGNDPFQRGAAQRSSEPQSPTEAPQPAQTAKKKAKGAPARAVEKKAAPQAEKKASKKAEKKAAQGKERKQGKARGPTREEAHRLREPAAPVTPRRRPPARVPTIPPETPEENRARTRKEQEVDRVLATAVAEEAAEAAAEAAAEIAVETMIALQAKQSGAESDLDAWNRELATAVVAEAAEAAVEAIMEAALEGVTPPPEQAAPEQDEDERRAMTSAYDEGAEAMSSTEATVIDQAYIEPDEDPDGVDTAGARAEAEVELPDGSDDEYLPRREVPLTLVPPPTDTPPAQEPFFHEQGQASEPMPEQGAPRSVGMFSLAKEIALQALTSASVGKAMGAAQGLLGAVRTGLGTRGSTSLDEYGRDPELVSELQPMMDFLYERYWRVSVQGVELVPTGGAILVANHSGALPFDGLVASMVLVRERPDLREPRWLVEDQVFHAPVLGTLFNRLGAVRACPENAVRLLDEQRPVLVFPEGYQGLSKPFAQRYQLKRFGRGGFVKLALRTGAPIIPVAVVGAEETSPLLGRIPAGFLGVPYVPLTGPVPLPAKWFVRFGEPISTEALGPEDADDLAEVQRVTERTRESIQGMLQSLLRERRSVFAG